MSMTASERYTTIGWEDDTKFAEISTCNRALQRRLSEYCKKYPESFKKIRDIIFEGETEVDIMEFKVEKKLISIRTPSKKKPMSEEQKKIVGERLQKTRKPREKKLKPDNTEV